MLSNWIQTVPVSVLTLVSVRLLIPNSGAYSMILIWLGSREFETCWLRLIASALFSWLQTRVTITVAILLWFTAFLNKNWHVCINHMHHEANFVADFLTNFTKESTSLVPVPSRSSLWSCPFVNSWYVRDCFPAFCFRLTFVGSLIKGTIINCSFLLRFSLWQAQYMF